eukprot:1136803-Pelagomonas_calceolata.AAC.4
MLQICCVPARTQRIEVSACGAAKMLCACADTVSCMCCSECLQCCDACLLACADIMSCTCYSDCLRCCNACVPVPTQ